MGRGSYRGGSTSVGWNANLYVSPALTGRTRKGKALIKDLTARTAQTRAEQQAQDARARKRHGLAAAALPPAPKAPLSGPAPGVATSPGAPVRRRKPNGGGFTVTVVKSRRPKPRRTP